MPLKKLWGFSDNKIISLLLCFFDIAFFDSFVGLISFFFYIETL